MEWLQRQCMRRKRDIFGERKQPAVHQSTGKGSGKRTGKRIGRLALYCHWHCLEKALRRREGKVLYIDTETAHRWMGRSPPKKSDKRQRSERRAKTNNNKYGQHSLYCCRDDTLTNTCPNSIRTCQRSISFIYELSLSLSLPTLTKVESTEVFHERITRKQSATKASPGHCHFSF